MNTTILIPISLFLSIFGIFYLFLSTRNKERLALIEKGVDASIFMHGRRPGSLFFRIVILNLAFLLIGVGLGIFIGLLLSSYTTLNQDALYPACIFTMAGLALLAAFKATKTLDQAISNN
ncbi:DUF6249 domain-containing protein [Dyadobacter subterraneus]|uniref:DUF6249 domain-containing protein n=1 Tax=Dyadobacter subterraneus TaxID=2773304 RepID=A0ABR9WEC1_9BACT|nr:DUF6249 domain-containing protein [Dyadobacter subterraneus]MBE9463838.1 hypothetical protein [Dyadobacter subterraneus]